MPARRIAHTAQVVPQHLREADIVDAALRVIRKVGADKLSMRALATELGVTPMAIYHHVPSKEALLDLIADSVLGNTPMPAPSKERWQAQMKAYAVTSWQLVSAYPELNRVLLTRGTTKGSRALRRYGISILLAAGFDAREAALAIATYHTYLYGAFGMIARGAELGKRARPRAAKAGKPAIGVTDAQEVGRHLRELRMEEMLEFGIDAVLAGIAAQLRAKPRART